MVVVEDGLGAKEGRTRLRAHRDAQTGDKRLI